MILDNIFIVNHLAANISTRVLLGRETAKPSTVAETKKIPALEWESVIFL